MEAQLPRADNYIGGEWISTGKVAQSTNPANGSVLGSYSPGNRELADQAAAVAPRFTASLSPEGQVQLRGLLPDERMRDAVDAFARARFGADLVHAATRIEDTLPEGWALRVLAGLAALSELGSGTLNMRDDMVELRGISGSQEARERITGILSERLGQGQDFRVEVSYDPKLDPFTPPPTAQECVDGANAILADGKITFAPGSARIDATARRTLNALADVLRDCMDVPLEIGGHTDSQGRAETNLRLSQQRADAVLQALLSLRVPVGAWAVMLFAAFEAMTLTLLPIYLVREGFSQQLALIMISVVVIGDALLQVPIGWLADKISRTSLFRGCGVVLLASSLAMPLVLHSPLIWPVLVLYGASAGGLYTLSLILVGQRYRDDALVRTNAHIALLWGIGCLLGPASTGAASQWLSSHALPMLMAAGALVFIYLAWQRGAFTAVAVEPIDQPS